MNPRGARTGRASGGRAAAAPDPQASATTGREAKLWQSADMLRNNMDVAECKHIVLGLIFLEKSLIKMAVSVNPGLLNRKNVQPESWGIGGLIRGGRGKRPAAARELGLLLGITSAQTVGRAELPPEASPDDKPIESGMPEPTAGPAALKGLA